jgi:aspartyl-tRNA(Asn)/glutamyl-tRNA(Gln) amidotransferase subunit A
MSSQAQVLPYIVEWARGGAALTGEQVFRGHAQIAAIRDATVAATQRFDAVLSPVSPVVSFPAEWASPLNDPARPFEHIAFTLPFNMSEQPAMALNGGYSAGGFPIGVQISARRHDDLGALRFARAFEELRGPQPPWPEPA